MNLTVKYLIKNTPNTAQLPNDATSLGVTGVNFIGANCPLAMTPLANPVAANASNKASILPTTANISSGTYVDKIVSVQIPDVLDATTVTYLSASLDKVGILNDIVGIEILGLNRTETATTAAFAKNVILDANLGFSISKNRLIITIGVAINAIQGSILNLRITHKN